jgi:uncharacterized DUF497 family protein
MIFDWDEGKNRRNLFKHGITFEEAVEVFNGSEVIEYDDENSTPTEDRFKAKGRIPRHGLIVVVFVEVVDDLLRIISAYKE